ARGRGTARSGGASKGATPAARSHGAAAGPRQLITVTAASYQATYATLTAYRRTGHGWQRVFGPWAARIGRNGFAPHGLKREGDGRTPSGSFSLLYVFGAGPNPGFRLRYRHLQPYHYLADDPS